MGGAVDMLIDSSLCTEKHISISDRLLKAETKVIEHEKNIEQILINLTSICKQLELVIGIFKWVFTILGGVTGTTICYFLKTHFMK